MSTHVIPEGTTEDQDFLLRDQDQDGTIEVINLTGLTLGIGITDKNGTAVTGAGTASIVTAASGHVRFAPTGTNLSASGSPYAVRWTATVAGKMFKVPNEVPADKWVVVQP